MKSLSGSALVLLTLMLGSSPASALVLLTAILEHPPYGSPEIAPGPWQEFAASSDFVGIVECTRAGGVVAEFKVIENWMGLIPKRSIRLRSVAPTLIGQQRLVFAHKEKTPANAVDAILLASAPLWSSGIDSDYRCSSFSQCLSSEQEAIQMWAMELDPAASLGDIRRQTKAFLSKSREQQELALMKALFEEYFVGEIQQLYDSNSISRLDEIALTFKQLVGDVRQSTASDELIDYLWGFSVCNLNLSQIGPRSGLIMVLSRGILTKSTLERVKALVAAGPRSGRQAWSSSLDIAQRRIDPPTGRTMYSIPQDAPVTRKELEGCRSALKDHTKHAPYKVRNAFVVVARNDPEFALEWLKKWTRPKEYPRFLKKWLSNWKKTTSSSVGVDTGYDLGAVLAATRREDRVKYLRAMLKARDAYVRAAAVDNLWFEDRKEALRQYRKMRNMSGALGLWANLNLAKRAADKRAMERVLRGFKWSQTNRHRPDHYVCWSLLCRAMALLSNSAAASNVPQPPNVADKADSYEIFLKWWKRHKDTITLYDPWERITYFRQAPGANL